MSSTFLICVKDDGSKYGVPPFGYPYVVERTVEEDGLVHWIEGEGIVRSTVREAAGQAQGYRLRDPKNRVEREAVARLAAAVARTRETYSLKRWTRRAGRTVEWGNTVAGFAGQSFRETFATEVEAIERERQAAAGESIGDERSPVPVERVVLHA